MKKGLILEIQNSNAVILKTNGEVVRLPAKDGWEAGSIVTLPARILPFGRIAAAACILAVVLLSLWTASASLSPVCLVSLDVNPSLEITVNRYGKVLSVISYNMEGDSLLQENDLLHKPLTVAVESMLNDGLKPYLTTSPYLAYSVQSSDNSLEEELLEQLRQVTNVFLEHSKLETDVSVDYYKASEEEVISAHHNNMTAGKYMTLLELQELYPQMQMEDYSHCSIGEIHDEINNCHGHIKDMDTTGDLSNPDSQTGAETEDSYHTHDHKGHVHD